MARMAHERLMTAWAFSSSNGAVVAISEEMTEVKYCSISRVLMAVSVPSAFRWISSSPSNSWSSLRSQWKPIPIRTSFSRKVFSRRSYCIFGAVNMPTRIFISNVNYQLSTVNYQLSIVNCRLAASSQVRMRSLYRLLRFMVSVSQLASELSSQRRQL